MRRPFTQILPLLTISLTLAGTLLVYAAAPTRTVPAETLSENGQITPRTRALLSAGSACVLGQPETVTDILRLEKLAISPDGSAVLVAAYKGRPYRGITVSQKEADLDLQKRSLEMNLVYWDVRTRVARTLFREAVREENISVIRSLDWLPGTRTVLGVLTRGNATTQAQTNSLIRVDTTSGTVTRLADLGEAGHASTVEVSPSQPFAGIVTQEETDANVGPLTRCFLRVYTPQGFRSPLRLPDGITSLNWREDGKSLYATGVLERDVAGKIVKRKLLTVVDLETGGITHPEKLPVGIKRENDARPLSLADWFLAVESAKTTVQDPLGQPKPTTALWLRTEANPQASARPSAPADRGAVSTQALLIATNARFEGYLAGTNTAAVLFTRDGSLCAAPIFRLPSEAFEQALRGVQRTATMENAKRAGLGILQYVQDYDERLPPSGEDVPERIDLYVKDRGVFENPATGENGFVYSYQGPTGIDQIGTPSTTQIGSVSGPGGRALIWADGHVTWVDDAPRL